MLLKHKNEILGEIIFMKVQTQIKQAHSGC